MTGVGRGSNVDWHPRRRDRGLTGCRRPLADPAVRNDFISWLGSGEGGETMTRLLPDITAEFDRGVDRGSGGGR